MPPLKPCDMLEHLDALREWQIEGRRACLATLVAVRGSAPRDPGAAMLIAQDGELRGTITGGCVEAALIAQARSVFVERRARTASYGVTDEQAHSVGLSCGGTLEIFLDEPDSRFVADVVKALREERPRAIALRLDEPHAGARLAVFANRVVGSLGNADLDGALGAELRTAEIPHDTAIRLFGEEGEPHGDVRVFVHRIAPKPRLYVFGAVDFASAMLRTGKLLGYEAILCDARAAFATAARFPDADRIDVAWPDDFLAREAIDERSAIVAMTHDEKFDLPLLRAALATPAFYIGAMGSRRTNDRRFAQLREAGVTEDALSRLSAPAGLDLGARTPEEIAIAIAGEIVAVRNGRIGGRLKHATGPLRGHAGDPGALLRLHE